MDLARNGGPDAPVSGAAPRNFLSHHPQIPGAAIDRYLSFGGQARPIAVTCETVNICNNDCVICAYSHQTRKRHAMRMDVFEKVLSEYSAMGGGLMSLTPMVGEVFLDKLLVERLKLLSSYPSINPVAATTNGVMVSNFDEVEIEFILGRLGKVQISIYGIDDEEYRAMTLKSTYQEMIEGILTILRYAKGDVALAFRCLKDRSRDDIDRWLDDVIRPHAARNFDVVPMSNVYANWALFDSSKKLPFTATWKPPPEEKKQQCALPLLAMQIYVNGDVSFCAGPDFDSAEDLHLGNVMEDSLLNLYNSEKAQRLWRWDAYGVPGFCKKCTFHQPLSNLAWWPTFFERPLDLMGG